MNHDPVASDLTGPQAALYQSNTAEGFWRPLIDPRTTADEWLSAVREALPFLPMAGAVDEADAIAATVGEELFGADRYRLSRLKSLYYQLKPVLPRFLTWPLRRRYTGSVRDHFPFGWPREDRYARFLWTAADAVRRSRGMKELPFIHFWPHGHRFALVLTHDIELEDGQAFVPRVMELEESLGFRSAFNFVLERYPLDHALIADLRRRGFEVGAHGLKHDGKLFSSRQEFDRRAALINGHLRELGVRGFRSPLTHRNPVWMQALDIDYDSSFFDTDPYEPMPGGTMSLWPFRLGRFWELPYTVPQDYVLTDVLHEITPQIWLDKVDMISSYCGMVLVNVHPDYLRRPEDWNNYQNFLETMSRRQDAWRALPSEVWPWWEARSQAATPDELPGAAVAVLSEGGSVEIGPVAATGVA
ncbi:MAG TPA: hypothetical protein VIA06_17880 [Candidatus Dormibacteraeota bacterium]|nr:hypothetical protein [Candidatus Dormibacteraeota bacterium]